MTDPTTDPPGYDPTANVSYTSMTLHRQCPQAWSYRYLEGLEPMTTGLALDLGSWWHLIRAMDSIDRGKATLAAYPTRLTTGNDIHLHHRADSRYVLPNGKTFAASRDLAHALVRAYWRTLGGDQKDIWIDTLGEPLPDRLRYMDARYLERWGADLKNEKPILVEARVKVPLPGTDATYSGVIDEVYYDEKRAMYVVRDHKTSSALPGADAEADLADSQLHLYAWAASQRVHDLTGKRVQAISYDRVRTAKPKEPSLTLAGNLSKGTSDYDLHTYLRFAAGPDGEGVPWGEPDTFVKTGPRAGSPKWGMYTAEEAVVEKLSTPAAQSVWHQRTLTPLNQRIVDSHVHSMAYSQRRAAETVAEFREHGEAPRNFSRWACRNCDFKRLCAAQLTGGPSGNYAIEDYGLTLREPHKH